MELIIAMIVFLALLVAWFVLPSSKTAHTHTTTTHESVSLPSIQQQV